MHMMTLRLPDNLINQIETISNQLERTKSFIVRKALETYFKEYADYQIALDRLNDKDDEIVSSKEMRHLVEKKHNL
ncbi:MAG: DNA-binding protein [Elusimicrobiota bacterium]